MPFVEILAPPTQALVRDNISRSITHGIGAAFDARPETMTLYFHDMSRDRYAHAGVLGNGSAAQRVFVKVHAYRRGLAERRRAAASITGPLAEAYGIPASAIAVYFVDRERDEVAHGGQMACDVAEA